MNKTIEQAVKNDAERRYKYNGNWLDNDTTVFKRQAFISGASFAMGLSRWIKERETKPPFDKWVLCYCGIYGFYIGCYMQLMDTGYGNWNDGKELGVLPPIFWAELPAPPVE